MGDVMIVTALKPQKKGKERVNLFLDGEFAVGLSASVIAKAGICPGQRLSPTEVENLKDAEIFSRALDRALRFLSYRPRSEAEIRVRLHRYGYDDEVIERTLERLRKLSLVDDAAFARFWRENREGFSPRSSRLLAQELRQKGIESEIIAKVIEGVDNETEAYRAGYKKARALTGVDYFDFRKKLGAFLYRRGFGYETIKPVVEKLWQEKFCEG